MNHQLLVWSIYLGLVITLLDAKRSIQKDPQP